VLRYNKDFLSSGILQLHLSNTENFTIKINILMQVNLETDKKHFPTLPRRHKVHLKNITKTSVFISWDRSPPFDLDKQFDVKYVVTLRYSDLLSNWRFRSEIFKCKIFYLNLICISSANKHYLTYCELEFEKQVGTYSSKVNNPFEFSYKRKVNCSNVGK